MKPLCVGIDDFCKLASIKRTKAYACISDGLVETRLLGRRRLITMRSIEALLGVAAVEEGK